jgi:hypothetical protein
MTQISNKKATIYGVLKWMGNALFILGLLTFLFTYLVNMTNVLSEKELPIYSLSEVYYNNDYRAVLIVPYDRIQVYSRKSSKFIRNFHIDSGGGDYDVKEKTSNSIKIYFYRGNKSISYGYEGELKNVGMGESIKVDELADVKNDFIKSNNSFNFLYLISFPFPSIVYGVIGILFSILFGKLQKSSKNK